MAGLLVLVALRTAFVSLVLVFLALVEVWDAVLVTESDGDSEGDCDEDSGAVL